MRRHRSASATRAASRRSRYTRAHLAVPGCVALPRTVPDLPAFARLARRLRRPQPVVGAGSPRGSVLVMALLVMLFLMGTAAATTALTLSRQSVAKTAKEVDCAYVAAEAGINHALYELHIDTDLGGDGVGNATGALGEGKYSATLTPVYAGVGRYTLRSIGTVGGIRRGVEAVVDRRSFQSAGCIGLDSLEIRGGIVDSYDSTAGTYLSQVGPDGCAGRKAGIASNGDIDISGAHVHGHARPGPTGLVMGEVENISGSTVPNTEVMTVDPYAYDPPIPSTGRHAGTVTFTSGTYRFKSFLVDGGQTATFAGDVVIYADDRFEISGSGQAIMNRGATLTIHHGAGEIKLAGDGIINQDQTPASLNIYSATANRVEISGSAGFYGNLYAPKAQFIASEGSQLFGTFLAKTTKLSGGCRLHMDTSRGSSSRGFMVVMMRPFQP